MAIFELEEEYLATLNTILQRQVQGNQSKIKKYIKETSKAYYNDNMEEINAGFKFSKYEACCFGHIYNQDKIKTLKSFKKLNLLTTEAIDNVLFNGCSFTLTIGDKIYKGEEAFRIKSRFIALNYSTVEAMIKIMDKFQLWKIF